MDRKLRRDFEIVRSSLNKPIACEALDRIEDIAMYHSFGLNNLDTIRRANRLQEENTRLRSKSSRYKAMVAGLGELLLRGRISILPEKRDE